MYPCTIASDYNNKLMQGDIIYGNNVGVVNANDGLNGSLFL